MKRLEKFKIDKFFLIAIIIFMIISIINIYSANKLLYSVSNLALRQIIWYIIGFILVAIIFIIKNKTIYKYINILYIIGNILLVCLLLFAPVINNTKSWFSIPGIGTIQPSEFMKIILIIMLAKTIDKFNSTHENPTVFEEFILILKVLFITFIPAILTFLQPDTGIVLIYLLITFVMLFISGIRYRWFFLLFILLGSIVAFILILFFLNNDLFIDIFGTSFFLRIDRLIDWNNNSGYQLTNGIAAIGSGGLFGFGIANTPIYFPEPQTDFIFAVFANNFGFIGSIALISFIALFDIKLIQLAKKTKLGINSYVISGIIGMLLYQQFQNIGMTFGVIPITGITLPFISYGGSSLLSYMLIIGIIFNISNEIETKK
ncbi:MAG: FtsW/RodA/SpoVE family cell cycle protein [Clostridium sp.]|nr:FtsW/RodA/SpoVE family cell cycle protein [Clostridium sp.]MCM1444465.1 FtsW/RodA/SpoVE family cell cycle protein [Candidatus Amulumruptor caecigallinarius]